MDRSDAGMTEETHCRSCGSAELTTFLELGDLPHSDGLRRSQDVSKPEPRYPLDVALCSQCSLVQILKTVPPEELFGDDYQYFSSFSNALLEHSRKNVEGIIESRGLTADHRVIELGSNDGYLLQHYAKAGISVLGIDPAAGPVAAARDKGIETVHEFFGPELAETLRSEGRTAHVIHGNNVLAHVADTNGFVAGIAALLETDGVSVIEVPYVRDLIGSSHKCMHDLAGISDLLAPDGTFIHPRAAERTKFCSAYNRPAPEAVTSAHADVEPTGAAAFRAFLRHRSTLVPFLRQPSLHSAARQPAGTGSAQILRSISPKSRRFR